MMFWTRTHEWPQSHGGERYSSSFIQQTTSTHKQKRLGSCYGFQHPMLWDLGEEPLTCACGDRQTPRCGLWNQWSSEPASTPLARVRKIPESVGLCRHPQKTEKVQKSSLPWWRFQYGCSKRNFLSPQPQRETTWGWSSIRKAENSSSSWNEKMLLSDRKIYENAHHTSKGRLRKL